LKERFGKMKIVSVSVLGILLLAIMSVSATVTAAPPKKETFEAIAWGDLTEPERAWVDGHGIAHFRGMVIEYTGIPGPGGPPLWYPGAITDMNLNIIGTMKVTVDADIDLYSEEPTGDGRLSMRGEATLYGDNYRTHLSGPIDGLEFSIPFVFVGREGCIKGTASGVMGYPAVTLSCTWMRQ